MVKQGIKAKVQEFLPGGRPHSSERTKKAEGAGAGSSPMPEGPKDSGRAEEFGQAVRGRAQAGLKLKRTDPHEVTQCARGRPPAYGRG